MSNELIRQQDTNLDIWHNENSLKEIKEIYAKGATETEWQMFMGIGRATGLNPFLRELWLLKYNGKIASIFIGRDGYRKTANRDKNYKRHHVEAVYEKDQFHYDVNTGILEHKYNFLDRGKIFGAYSLVFMRNSDIPFYRFVTMKEYDQEQSVWKTKPRTMIEKVAEAQGLRMACPELFGGTLDESEEYALDNKPSASVMISEMVKPQAPANKASNPFDQAKNAIEAATTEEELKASTDFIRKVIDKKQLDELRTNYQKKRDDLRGIKAEVNEETGEVIEAEYTATQTTEFEKIKLQLEKAKSLDVLDVAADLIRTIPDDQESTQLLQIYQEKRKMFSN